MIVTVDLKPDDPITSDAGRPVRDRALDQQQYADEADRFLDYWYGGSPQRHRLQQDMIRRGGSVQRTLGDGLNDVTTLDDDGDDIAKGKTELATFRYTRKICQDVGVLYSSDDLNRTYVDSTGEANEAVAKTMGYYQAPERGNMTAYLHVVDPWLIGLRVVGLLCSWVAELGELSYEVMPPHWFHFWQHHLYPKKIRLAFAAAYAESEGRDEYGRPISSTRWVAYVRPMLGSDPHDAPTRFEPFRSATGDAVTNETGRYVRWEAGGVSSEPWPIPPPGDPSIIEDEQNPLVMAGGWEDGRRVWQPIVVHTAEPLVEALRLPISDDICNMNSEIDQGITEALHTANLQLKGIPVFTGPDATPGKIGPQNPVRLPTTDSSFAFQSPSARPKEHLDAMHEVVQLGGMLSNLSVDSLSLRPPSITTGPAMMMRRADLIQERENRVVDAVRPEARRFDLERVLHNAHGVTPTRPAIPWEIELRVNWGHLTTPVDLNKRLDELAKELTMGVTTKEEALMEVHGVDMKEAQRRLLLAEEKSLSEDVDPDAAYTGIQIDKMLLNVEKVAAQRISRGSGVAILRQAYPITQEDAEEIMDENGKTFFSSDFEDDTDDVFGSGQAESQGVPGMSVDTDR